MSPEEWAVQFLARKPGGNPVDVLAEAFRQAVAEAVSVAMLPGAPLTPAQLDAIRERAEGGLGDESWSPDFIIHARTDIPALLEHIAYLEGLIGDLAADGNLDIYQRGYADGKKARETPRILLRRQDGVWRARLAADERLIAAANRPDEALGALVRNHQEAFGLRVEFEEAP